MADADRMVSLTYLQIVEKRLAEVNKHAGTTAHLYEQVQVRERQAGAERDRWKRRALEAEAKLKSLGFDGDDNGDPAPGLRNAPAGAARGARR